MYPLEFTVEHLNLSALAPILIVFAAGAVGMLIEAFVHRGARHGSQVIVATIALVAALAITIRNWMVGKLMLGGALAISADGPSYFLWALLIIFAILSLFLFAERKLYDGASVFTPMGVAVPGSQDEREAIAMRNEHTEVYPLALFALTGMMVFVSANDFITLFVALEVMSLPLYVLAGLARRRRLLSQEAALKYFLLGSMSSALFLFGIALLYGYTGSFDYTMISELVGASDQHVSLLLGGIALVAIGLLFKMGAVPFHSWTPDVYQGAPTPVTAFFASCTKIAAVGAITRVLYVALGAAAWDWQPFIAAIAALTIVVGSVLAVMQTDMKRMLAYSSVAHAGFLLTAVVGLAAYSNGVTRAGSITSVAAILFYLAGYGFATLGAFAIVTMVRNHTGEANAIESWSGLGRRHPALGLAMALFLMSFAGIPLTSGFIGKWAVFAAAWQGGYWWLVVIAVFASLIAAFFYLRVIIVMFFDDDDAQGAPARRGAEGGGATAVERSHAVVEPAGITTWIPIVVGAVATVALGLFPGPLLDVAMRASEFLR